MGLLGGGGAIRPLLTPVVAPAVYQGPKDVVGINAIVWWGLRAYSLASIGSNAIRLRRDSDNTENDFATVTGGGLDTASITTFKGAANLFVTKLYDQTGGGLDVVQATAANQSTFTLSGFGSLPIMTLAKSGPTFLLSTANYPTTAQPLIASIVEKSTSGNSQFFGGWDNASNSIIDDTFVNTQIQFYAGSIATGSPVANGWLSLQVLFNGASSSMMVNGSAVTTTNPGTNNLTAGRAGIGALSFGGNADTIFQEGGWWAGDQSASFTALTSNQRSYWGF